jgi:phospholipid-binding lipoprotein MlaA
MATIQLIRPFRGKTFVKATGLLVSIIATGFIVALPSHAQTGLPSLGLDHILSNHQPLAEHTTRLDQQLADAESRLHTIRINQDGGASEADPQTVEHVSQQVATRVDIDHPSNLETVKLNEPEVQRLDETIVQDTYLDPFSDETQIEVIPDPWEPMNAKVFSFNMHVDRFVLKPMATGYAWLLPDPVEQAIGRAIANIRFVPRTVNDLLQWKWKNAGIEVGRFVINSTAGIAGLFDVAGDYLGLKAVPAEDFGQTLAMHGVQPGAYLVLPFLPPTTVRDGIGTVGDVLLDPLTYFLPFLPQASVRATEIVNERSQNLERYEGVEVATLDMYGAVREAYAQKRSQAIRE